MERTPPGPKGEPLFGDSRTFADDPFRFAEALEEAYGDVARFDLGPVDTFALTAPELIERVLVTDADQYRKPEFQRDALGTLLGDGLLLGEGERWEQQRDLANPAFDMARLAGMDDRIVDHARSIVGDWAVGDEVNVERAMTHVTIDVILDLMMGVELSADRVATIQEQLVPIGARFEPDPLRFAMPEWVPMPDDAAFESAVRTLDEILEEILERRQGTAGSEEDGPMDLLSILLRARKRGEQSDRQLRDELMTMLLAGHDTTALTLTYTWFLLSEHPEVETRLHEEVDEIVGDDRPSIEHVREFEYLDWVINEAMRLYPPVYAIFRTPTAPVELGGYEVPPSANIMLSQWAVHRSDRHWADPECFEPERFAPERRRDRPRFAFFPFGGGPRHCIGKQLALLEAKLIVATIASQYRLDFQGETPLELQPSLTAHPRQEMTMTIENRS